MAARPTGVPMDTGSNPWEVKDLFPGPRASVTKFMEIKSSAHGNWVEQRGTHYCLTRNRQQCDDLT